METRYKLKLLRALTGLSQKELADVVGVSHNFIAVIEKGVREIPKKRAKMLADTLHIDVEWLTGDSCQIVAEQRFALFCFDGKKEIGSSISTQNRSISAAEKIIGKQLPELFINSTDISYRYIGLVNPGSALFFVVFNGHGLLFKVTNCEAIVAILARVVKELKGTEGANVKEVIEEVCPFDACNVIAYSEPEKLKRFIDQQNIGREVKIDFKESVVRHRELMIKIAIGSEGGVKNKTLEETTREYVLQQKENRTSRICNEIMDNNISLSEIWIILKKAGRNDLIPRPL